MYIRANLLKPPYQTPFETLQECYIGCDAIRQLERETALFPMTSMRTAIPFRSVVCFFSNFHLAARSAQSLLQLQRHRRSPARYVFSLIITDSFTKSDQVSRCSVFQRQLLSPSQLGRIQPPVTVHRRVYILTIYFIHKRISTCVTQIF